MTVTVPDILGSLFNPSDEVCFRIFDDKKTGTFRGLKLNCECRGTAFQDRCVSAEAFHDYPDEKVSSYVLLYGWNGDGGALSANPKAARGLLRRRSGLRQ